MGMGYKYVDLTKIIHSINPLMQKHGLGFTQMLGTNPESGNTCVTTTIFHIESGENNSSTVDVPLVEMKGQNSYQSIGSGCSYFKRYQLSSALGIVSDKDTDAYGDQVKTNAKKQLDLGPTEKVVPKNEVTVVTLDIGDDSLYEVLHKVIKYRDEGNSFEKIIGDLKKKYNFNIATEKYIKDIYDGEKTK